MFDRDPIRRQAVLDFDPNADMDFLTAFARDIREQIRNRENREQMLQQMKEFFSNSIQLSTPKYVFPRIPCPNLNN